MSYVGGMSVYDDMPRVIEALSLISQGQTRTKACFTAGISVKSFLAYINADRELAEQMQEALVLGRDAMADALLDPQAHVLYGSTDPKMAKIYSDNIKWLLARLDRERFGDRIDVKQEITLAFAITDELEKARARSQLALPPVADFIDVEFSTVYDDEDISSLLG